MTTSCLPILHWLKQGIWSVTPEFDREEMIHSSSEKEGKYLPTFLQSLTIVVSALSPLEFGAAPSLWNLSQKHCLPTQSQHKLKTVFHPDPFQHSSPQCPTAPELSSVWFQSFVKHVTWPPSPYPIISALS